MFCLTSVSYPADVYNMPFDQDTLVPCVENDWAQPTTLGLSLSTLHTPANLHRLALE